MQNSAEQTPIDTRQEIAKAAGVSHDTIAKVEKIEAQASPEIKTALKSGDMSINQAYKEIKRVEKETRQEERRERKSYTPPTELPTDKFKLIRADIRDGLHEIADNSVDFIITTRLIRKNFCRFIPTCRNWRRGSIGILNSIIFFHSLNIFSSLGGEVEKFVDRSNSFQAQFL